MQGRRILVVDDERIVAHDIMEVLNHMGCEVVGTALSGEEAIEKAGQFKPDLILMDITLQGQMDGVEAASIIRKKFDIACVFLTAYSDASYLERAKLTQPAGYMVKPFEEAGLRSTVEIALYKVDLERALKESNEWLQTTLMSIGDGVIATSADGRVRFMNPLAESITGWASAEATGKRIEEIFLIADEKSGQPVPNPALVALKEGRIANLERGTSLQRKDGTKLPIDDSGAPIRNGKGEIVGAVLVFRDISEQRNAELEIQLHKEHLEELVEERTAEILKTNDLLRLEIEERKRAERALEYRARMETLLATIAASFLRTKTTDLDSVTESALSQIGAFLTVDRCYLLQTNNDGQTVSCTHEWSVQGVPPLKNDFQRIPLAAFAMGQAKLASGAAVLVSHSGGNYLPTLNPHLAQARQAKSVLVVQLAENDQPVALIGIDTVHEDHDWREEDANLLCLAADPILSAQRRRRMEEEKSRLQSQLTQSQKMEAVGKLSSGIAHDFNNMLLPIIGYADMVLGRLPEGHESAFELKEIRRVAEKAATLTRQLLAFSRKQVVKKSIFDVNHALQNMSAMLRRIIGEDFRMEMNLATDLLPIQADIGQLEQVVMNLCVNARDAMPGGGQILIQTRNVNAAHEPVPRIGAGAVRAGEFVCISVTDTGTGIPDEVAERIFEPFFTTKGTEGTGLGLSVIYGIIEEHGGGIGLDTQLGRGSTFRIYYPAIRANLPKVEEVEQQQHRNGAFRGQGQKVLLVEDEEAVNRLVRNALSQNGYQVTAASCVREAMQRFEEGHGQFNMVFSDAVLPDGNGVDLIGVLLHRNPNLRVLLSSGYTDKHHLMDMARQMQISFLPKPYSLPKLFQTVAEVMADQRSHMLI